jgi:antigen 43
MATISWRGGNGKWSALTDWSLFRLPTASDSVVLPTGAAYTVTLDGLAAAQDVAVAAGGTLALSGTLDLGGTLTDAGALQLSGLLVGGTLDLTQGSAGGLGTLEGVTVLGGFSGLSGVTIDAATAQFTAAANGGTVALADQTTLLGGHYSLATLLLGVNETIDASGAVTIDGNASVQQASAIGGDAVVNLGSIGSTDGIAMSITAQTFTNAGDLVVQPGAAQLNSNTFVVGYQTVHGLRLPTYGELFWTTEPTGQLSVGSASFSNSGLIAVPGGSLAFGGGSVLNTGIISLPDVISQSVTSDVNGVFAVADGVVRTLVDIGAGVVDFTNSGIIEADEIDFQGSVALANLGTLHGALTFAGTLDLGGGTLDASAYGSVTITGTVENGTLLAGTGVLTTDSATLVNAVIGTGGGLTQSVTDPPPGTPVTLDAAITRMLLTAGGTSHATVFAGSTQVVDTIQLLTAGSVTLASDFSLTAAIPGSTVQIAGASGTVVLDGSIAVDAATLLVSATLDGGGGIAVGNGGAVTLEALAVTATPTIDFGVGAALLVLPGTGALGVVLSGLQAGDVVDFLSVSSVPSGPFATGGAAASQGSLDVTGASGDSVSVAMSGPAAGLTFQLVPDGAGGSLLQVACFARGTRLATPGGDAQVESLRPGDAVLTASGRVAPVRWVGCTSLDLRRHPAPDRAAPIRIAAGALPGGVPLRDLLVSPEHCLLLDGALIPAVHLLNGASIARDDSFSCIEYWHVELDRHDAVLAEGVATESYLDTGNRALFAGTAGMRALHPDLAGPPDAAALRIWAAHGCAPLWLTADDVRAALRERAQATGWHIDTDPELVLFAGGAALPWQVAGNGIAATLPAGCAALRLLTKSFVPSEVVPGSGDTRRLGVAVGAALLAGWPLHPDAFSAGWRAAAGEAWRWTDGDATLRFPRLARPTALHLTLGPPGLYWRRPAVSGARRAA